MDVTRRFWGTAAAGALLAALAVAFGRPVLLAGAGGVGALLVARQLAFVRALTALDDDLSVSVSPTDRYVRRDDETAVTLAVDCPGGASLPLTVTATPPVVAGSVPATERTVRLDAGDERTTTTFAVDWPAVGEATFPRPTVSVADEFGLFTETVERGSERTVVVEPHQPRRLHVGEGGDAAAAFGGHRTSELGQGTDPAEIRQYVPGDSIRDIDWKATARLAYPHVREYEVESDRRTVLVVDHRERLATGPAGERALDYLREVALTVAGAAERATDPLGCYTVGDRGVTAERDPATTDDHYRDVRSLLRELTPTDADDTDEPGGGRPGRTRGISDARRSAELLADDDSAFGATLTPYLGDRDRYVQLMERDSLFETVRTRVGRLTGSHWVLVFTDDTDRPALRETVRLAQSEGDQVVVFLAPSVLYEPGGLADLDAAYERYADFEAFRLELTRPEGVTAYEVAPGERLDAVLSANDRR